MAYGTPTTPVNQSGQPPAPVPTGWIEVSSSCLSAVRVVAGQHASAVTLQIEFHSGKRYEARGVPHEMVADLLTAGSVGGYYNAQLKGAFRWREI